MASELIVQTLRGPASGANANKIIVPSGQTLDASAGFVPPAGAVVNMATTGQYSADWWTSSSSYSKTNLKMSYTPLYANSKLIIMMQASFLNQGSELDMKLYRDATLVTTYGGDAMIHGDYDGNGSYSSYTMHFTDSPNTTSQVEYAIYAKCSPNNGYVYRNQCVTIMEIAQ